MKALLAALLVVLVGLANPAWAGCEKRTPYGRFSEKVQLARPCETVINEVTFRNTDSCECEPTCFTLSYGPHGIPDGIPGVRVDSTRLRDWEGNFFPHYVCLAPGQETRAFVHTALSCEQEPFGYTTPSVMMEREGARYTFPDIFVDWFDVEGPATCIGYDYWQCREFAYGVAHPHLLRK